MIKLAALAIALVSMGCFVHLLRPDSEDRQSIIITQASHAQRAKASTASGQFKYTTEKQPLSVLTKSRDSMANKQSPGARLKATISDSKMRDKGKAGGDKFAPYSIPSTLKALISKNVSSWLESSSDATDIVKPKPVAPKVSTEGSEIDILAGKQDERLQRKDLYRYVYLLRWMLEPENELVEQKWLGAFTLRNPVLVTPMRISRNALDHLKRAVLKVSGKVRDMRTGGTLNLKASFKGVQFVDVGLNFDNNHNLLDLDKVPKAPKQGFLDKLPKPGWLNNLSMTLSPNEDNSQPITRRYAAIALRDDRNMPEPSNMPEPMYGNDNGLFVASLCSRPDEYIPNGLAVLKFKHPGHERMAAVLIHYVRHLYGLAALDNLEMPADESDVENWFIGMGQQIITKMFPDEDLPLDGNLLKRTEWFHCFEWYMYPERTERPDKCPRTASECRNPACDSGCMVPCSPVLVSFKQSEEETNWWHNTMDSAGRQMKTLGVE